MTDTDIIGRNGVSEHLPAADRSLRAILVGCFWFLREIRQNSLEDKFDGMA